MHNYLVKATVIGKVQYRTYETVEETTAFREAFAIFAAHDNDAFEVIELSKAWVHELPDEVKESISTFIYYSTWEDCLNDDQCTEAAKVALDSRFCDLSDILEGWEMF